MWCCALGNRGSGKSVVMSQMVMEARKAGWLVLYIPRGRDHVQGGAYIEAVPRGVYNTAAFVTGEEMSSMAGGGGTVADNNNNSNSGSGTEEQLAAVAAENDSSSSSSDEEDEDWSSSDEYDDDDDDDDDEFSDEGESEEASRKNSRTQPRHSSSASSSSSSSSSSTKPSPPLLFDNVLMSAEALRQFWLAHSSDLRGIPLRYNEEIEPFMAAVAKEKDRIRRTRAVPGRSHLGYLQVRAIADEMDNFPEQDALDVPMLGNMDIDKFELNSIEDLLLLGLCVRRMAGVVFMQLVRELRAVDARHVLIAVDQYNTWEGPSVYRYGSREVLGWDLCVPRSLRMLRKSKSETAASWNMRNGFAVAAVSGKHTGEGGGIPVQERYLDSLSSLPLAIRVPDYNQVEFVAALQYYTSVRRTAHLVTLSQLLAYRTMCASNPRQLRLNAVEYFSPIDAVNFGANISWVTLTEEQSEWLKEEEKEKAVPAPGGGGGGVGQWRRRQPQEQRGIGSGAMSRGGANSTSGDNGF